MKADNSHHLIVAARQRQEQTLARAEQALAEAEVSERGVTVTDLARSARVSRAWLYTQPALRDRIQQLSVATACRPAAVTQRASDASLKSRLELAHARVRQLTEENARLREQISRALGEQRHSSARRVIE